LTSGPVAVRAAVGDAVVVVVGATVVVVVLVVVDVVGAFDCWDRDVVVGGGDVVVGGALVVGALVVDELAAGELAPAVVAPTAPSVNFAGDVWNPNTPARPARVPATTIGARLTLRT
jgi:hypothetical protein